MTGNSEIGKVHWFDKKKGYGFAKIINPSSKYFEEDVFIHFTSIICENDFKYLYPGETISLTIEENIDEGSNKKYKTSNVRGVFNTNLMVDNKKFLLKVIRRKDEEENMDDPVYEDEDEGEDDIEDDIKDKSQ